MSEKGIDLFFLTLETYIRGILSRVPGVHWAVIVVLSLALTSFFVGRKYSGYSATAFGVVVFVGIFLLDTAVVIRYFGMMDHASGYNLTLDFARCSQKGWHCRAELLSNFAVFVPFGFFLSEFMSSTERFGTGSRIGLVTMAAFGLSLLIESLQLILHVGFFELTDLLMNTLGGFFGACLSLLGRAAFRRFRKTG